MEITAIEPHRKSFLQLYIDGEAAVKIDKETLLKAGLKPGDEITDEELHELIQNSDARRAHEKALYLLEHRSHSRKELEDKIARTAASREAAKQAASHMEEIGLVNDEQFAKSFAAMLVERKKYGLRRVKQELRLKGIDRDLIDEILEEYAENDNTAALQEILAKKYPRFAEDEKIKRRAVAALQRLGYRFDEIRTAMQDWQEDCDEE